MLTGLPSMASPLPVHGYCNSVAAGGAEIFSAETQLGRTHLPHLQRQTTAMHLASRSEAPQGHPIQCFTSGDKGQRAESAPEGQNPKGAALLKGFLDLGFCLFSGRKVVCGAVLTCGR